VKKLNDYSGPFIPDLKFSDFSKDTLVRLLEIYCQFYMALDGFWYLTVKDRVSNEEALTCDLQVWDRLAKYEIIRITRLLDLQGNDVATLMKILQLTPWQRQTRYHTEFISPHRAIMTVTDCATLRALEKEGLGREKYVCQQADPHILQRYASLISPDIKVRYLKVPPRKSPDDICCQWEFAVNG